MTLAAFKTRRPEQCELSFLDAGFPAPSFERSQRKDVHHPELPFSSDQPGPVARAHDVQSGKSCGSRRWSFGGIFKQLYLSSAPRHGKVVLSFPGRYDYTPSPGYLGDDTFTLKICGVVNGGFEGCADLLFSVNVVPPGI